MAFLGVAFLVIFWPLLKGLEGGLFLFFVASFQVVWLFLRRRVPQRQNSDEFVHDHRRFEIVRRPCYFGNESGIKIKPKISAKN